jgi:hypothetical protein
VTTAAVGNLTTAAVGNLATAAVGNLTTAAVGNVTTAVTGTVTTTAVTMTTALAAAFCLAACEREHVVTIQLGPSDDTLTAGFNCVQDADTMKLLAARALQPDNSLRFAVVVDVISLGGQLPGCRGEELFAACPAGRCTIVPRADGTRYCEDITVSAADVAAALNEDSGPMLNSIRTQLQAQPVTLDAPDVPVLIRSVATTESCAAIPTEFDLTRLVGCAYSCPVQLDEVDGPVALSLDTLTRMCEREVKFCAAFPP